LTTADTRQAQFFVAPQRPGRIVGVAGDETGGQRGNGSRSNNAKTKHVSAATMIRRTCGDIDVDAGLAQGDGGGQAADTGADNGDLERW
jgi:hypothetical protein